MVQHLPETLANFVVCVEKLRTREGKGPLQGHMGGQTAGLEAMLLHCSFCEVGVMILASTVSRRKVCMFSARKSVVWEGLVVNLHGRFTL